MASAAASPQAMDDNELASLLAQHESRAVGYYNSEIAEEQAKAINYYYGRMEDVPAIEGCSSVVDNTVAIMVDNGLASVLKPFVSADEVVSFTPRGPEDVKQAEQATEYVNYVINCDNPGFMIFHNWFKDALLTKIGVVKVWWEDQSKTEEGERLVDAMGIEEARQQDDYLSEEERPDGLYAIKHQVNSPDGRVRIENVPPEEFLITPYARSLDCIYVAHRPTDFRRSDLLEMGADRDVVESLPAFSGSTNEESRSQARYRDEDWSSGNQDENANDPSQDVIAVLDEYVKVDYDGDGISELRRVIRVDDVILLNEPVDECPFALICPVPMPHKVYGRSTADQSMEQQKIATAVKRQTLDNLYKTNNPRPVINESGIGESTMDDLGSTVPGAGIRIKTAGTLDWSVVPFSAQHSFPMLEYVAQEAEERTGFQRKGNGMNAEALKKNSPDTATQAAIDENSRNERAELIARIFAETGVKTLFKLILKLLVAHQPKERIIRLRNEFVPMDPRNWSPDMDLEISTALGVGNKAEQIAQADSVLQTFAEMEQTQYAYLIDAQKVYNALKRKLTAIGIKDIDNYLLDPATTQPPPPPPNPEEAKAQAEMQLKQQDQQARQQESQIKLQLQQQEAAQKLQLSQQEAAAKMQLMREEAGAKLQFEREKATAEIEISREKMQAELVLAREQMAIDTQLQAQRNDNDKEVGLSKQRAGGDLDK
jgi:hypothetical protein